MKTIVKHMVADERFSSLKLSLTSQELESPFKMCQTNGHNKNQIAILKYFHILLLIFPFSAIKAEGTAQFTPPDGSNNPIGTCQIQIHANDYPSGYRKSYLENQDSLHRLYIHINNTSEKIYFGFHPDNSPSSTNGKQKFRIKSPSGIVVYPNASDTTQRQTMPTSGAGYIADYAHALAGPSPLSGGYTPLSYQPTVTGDFYMEFQDPQSYSLSGSYYIKYFDVTVLNVSNVAQIGRLWTYAWDLTARNYNVGANTTFYVYTSDHYLSSVNVNGIQPYSFVIACNDKGTANTGNQAQNRKSVDGDYTYPEYKIFLNMPDTSIYHIGKIPSMTANLSIQGAAISGSNVVFYINMTTSGTLDIMLDLNNDGVYTPNSADVLLVKAIQAGGDTIVWNGKNGFGATVSGNFQVLTTSKFSTGVTHLPVYDPEGNPNGYIVYRKLPLTEQAKLYWDDSNFADGTTNLTGSYVGDTWLSSYNSGAGFGNDRTMNTWWSGYENDNLASFTFTMSNPLPIELLYFTAKTDENNVFLSWATATEKNNSYFTIERSVDGQEWEDIVQIDGAGTTTMMNSYSYIDKDAPYGSVYYRLKQTDINGTSTFSDIESVRFDNSSADISIYPNPTSGNVSIFYNGDKSNILSTEIYNAFGERVYHSEIFQAYIDLSDLPNGVYYLFMNVSSKIISKKVIVIGNYNI